VGNIGVGHRGRRRGEKQGGNAWRKSWCRSRHRG
jgi:hypothetical protein